MAAKGVNLLDDDSEGEPMDDYGENLGSSLGSPRSSEKKGGLLRNLVMGLVVLALLGGGAWAGYQFWWIPKQIQEQKRLEAQKRLEELKRQRREQAKEERAKRKKELALLQKMRAEEEKAPETKGATETTAIPKTPGPPVEKIAPKMTSPAKVAMAAPIMQEKSIEKPLLKGVKQAPLKNPQMAMSPKSSAPQKTSAQKRAPKQKAISSKKIAPPPNASKTTASRYYSVQVATCRTNQCVAAFSKRLRAKGYAPIVSGRAKSSVPSSLTEVIIGEFGDNDSAQSLASSAKEKKISASVYQKNNRWLVSAGAYPDLEDAAERLDQVEDSGFRGRLSLKKGVARKTGLRSVRTGKLTSRREALALRSRISQSGFPGSYVVRR